MRRDTRATEARAIIGGSRAGLAENCKGLVDLAGLDACRIGRVGVRVMFAEKRPPGGVDNDIVRRRVQAENGIMILSSVHLKLSATETIINQSQIMANDPAGKS